MILSFIRHKAFDPEEVEIMAAAFEQVWYRPGSLQS
jgi:hypothetical protein